MIVCLRAVSTWLMSPLFPELLESIPLIMSLIVLIKILLSKLTARKSIEWNVDQEVAETNFDYGQPVKYPFTAVYKKQDIFDHQYFFPTKMHYQLANLILSKVFFKINNAPLSASTPNSLKRRMLFFAHCSIGYIYH
jgi:hypothetical protein